MRASHERQLEQSCRRLHVRPQTFWPVKRSQESKFCHCKVSKGEGQTMELVNGCNPKGKASKSQDERASSTQNGGFAQCIEHSMTRSRLRNGRVRGKAYGQLVEVLLPVIVFRPNLLDIVQRHRHRSLVDLSDAVHLLLFLPGAIGLPPHMRL
jgi:hypothetical protein